MPSACGSSEYEEVISVESDRDLTPKAAAPPKKKPRNVDAEYIRCTLLCTYNEKTVTNETFIWRIQDSAEALISRLVASRKAAEAVADRRGLAIRPHHQGTMVTAIFNTRQREASSVSFTKSEDFEQNLLPLLWYYFNERNAQPIVLDFEYRFGNEKHPPPPSTESKKRVKKQELVMISSDPSAPTEGEETPIKAVKKGKRSANERNKDETGKSMELFKEIVDTWQCRDVQCSNNTASGVVGCYILAGEHFGIVGAHVNTWRIAIEVGDATVRAPTPDVVDLILKEHRARLASKTKAKQPQQVQQQEPIQQQQAPIQPQQVYQQPWWQPPPWMSGPQYAMYQAPHAPHAPHAHAPPVTTSRQAAPNSSPPRSVGDERLEDPSLLEPYMRWLRRKHPLVAEHLKAAQERLVDDVYCLEMLKKEPENKLEKRVPQSGIRRLIRKHCLAFTEWLDEHSVDELSGSESAS